jgi:hypothetical protein
MTSKIGSLMTLVLYRQITILNTTLQHFRALLILYNSAFKLYKKLYLYYLLQMNRVEQMKKIQSEALELFTKKNIDYGDAFAKYGVIGVLMRIEDKLQRSMSITKNGVNLISDEGIRDTLIDLHNYAAMALMLLDE